MIQNEENQNVEYKSNWRDEYLKWVCGFANAADLPVPTFEEKMGGIWVTIPRKNSVKSENVGVHVGDVGVNVGANVGDVGVNVGVKANIIKFIKDNPSISVKELSNLLNITTRTIERNIKQLKEMGVLERIGSDKTGSWIIIDKTV